MRQKPRPACLVAQLAAFAGWPGAIFVPRVAALIFMPRVAALIFMPRVAALVFMPRVAALVFMPCFIRTTLAFIESPHPPEP